MCDVAGWGTGESTLRHERVDRQAGVTTGEPAQDGRPDPLSSVLKIKGSEIQQTTTELLMEVIGPFAVPYDEHGDEGSNESMDWTAQIAPSYFNNRKVSIYGGSNEIQRNIITKAVLGL